jgi:thioredoxin reductase (NADPH)
MTMAKPIILAVDTEQRVGDALERDLQKRYGSDYTILVERSPTAALEHMRHLQGTDAEVALLITSLWMGEMSGIDFLIQAHRCAPDAKRLILIAFGDTAADAAIASAATLGQFESLVTKPWASPEEQLYPAVGELLSEWAKGHLPCFEAVRIVGAQWSADTYQLRDLLERNPVSYGFYDEDSPTGQQLLADFHLDAAKLPAALLYDGHVMIQPTPVALAAALGAHLQAQPQLHDLAIVGAGPAGLAAAVYGASEGLDTVAIEAEAVGGQAGASAMIRNYLGYSRGVSGHDLATHAYQQSVLLGADIVFMNTATGLRAEGDRHVITVADGSEITTRTVVIATGAAYRRMGIPEVEALRGKGVYYGAVTTEASGMRGRRVFVAGAGNSAGQAAIHLAKYAQQVTILVRGDALAPSMSDYLIKQIDGTPNIAVRSNTQVVTAHGSERLEALDLRNLRNAAGATETVPADGLFALIGVDPHTDWLAKTLARDTHGFIMTGHDLLDAEGKPPAGWPLARPPYHLETILPGVFAVGDVRSGSMKRVASAVGEGATAISLIHQYLGS